jgi:hypothetical protein
MAKHDLRFRRSGRFAPAPMPPLLAAMLRAKSEPHVKGWDTRRRHRRAAIVQHIRDLGGQPERYGL